MNLADKHCEACRVDAPKLEITEVDGLLKGLPQWQKENRGEVLSISRIFSFANYIDALAFTNRVAAVAEEEGHHPELILEWGRVKVAWWTHKIQGLHRNDFIMAAKTERLYQK